METFWKQIPVWKASRNHFKRPFFKYDSWWVPQFSSLFRFIISYSLSITSAATLGQIPDHGLDMLTDWSGALIFIKICHVWHYSEGIQECERLNGSCDKVPDINACVVFKTLLDVGLVNLSLHSKKQHRIFSCQEKILIKWFSYVVSIFRW